MVQTKWANGMHYLFNLRRVKQIFASVNDVNSFIDLVYIMIDIVKKILIDAER